MAPKKMQMLVLSQQCCWNDLTGLFVEILKKHKYKSIKGI